MMLYILLNLGTSTVLNHFLYYYVLSANTSSFRKVVKNSAKNLTIQEKKLRKIFYLFFKYKTDQI